MMKIKNKTEIYVVYLGIREGDMRKHKRSERSEHNLKFKKIHFVYFFFMNQKRKIIRKR